MDDVLDVTSTTDALGKTAGRDAALGKSTYPALLGVDGARRRARALMERGIERANRAENAHARAVPSRSFHGHTDVLKSTRKMSILDSINSPADLKPMTRDELRTARRRDARAAHRRLLAHRRPHRRRPRRGRADDRAALRVRHAARPARVGRRAPGLSAQAAHRPQRADGDAAPGRRHLRLPQAHRERVRHVRRRPRRHGDLGRARHGRRARHQRARTSRSSPSSATARSRAGSRTKG